MSSAQGTSNTTTQEFIVRAPSNRKKSYCMMKFATGTELDFVKLSQTPVKMERENNLREFKSAYGIDQQPKFGAGSEFGREQREEARRKKFGIRAKKYNIDAQPWLLKIGANKTTKKYKGVREGTITDNTSYYIFVQCPDGAFEAIPIEEWYNFTPVTTYKYLNSEEAEEEFSRRDKTMNLFNVMLKKRIRNDEELEAEEKEEKKKGGKKGKEFFLTDGDEWAMMDDEDDGGSDDEKEKDDDEEKPKKKGDKKAKKAKRNAKINSDDEAVEESDEGDYDDREVDYITDSDSEQSEDEARDKDKNYEEKGVDEETGLKKMIDSDDSEDEEKKEQNEENKDEKEKKDDDFDSDSSSSDSDSDSDIDKSENISAIFMQKKNVDKKRDRPTTPQSNSATPRSGTPVAMETDQDKAGLKRKADDEPQAKKPRTDSPLPSTASSPSTSSEGMTEDSIRRYLLRKPMTTKDLLQKFRSKKLNLTNEQMTATIAQILKKLNPEKAVINKKLYLSLKKP